MKTHLTASAVVVTADGEHVLLHRHRWSGLWIQPGGHIDIGEQPWEAARREATEETGIDGLAPPNGQPTRMGGSVHPSPRKPHEDAHLHDDSVWLLVAPTGAQPRPPANESQECRFLGWDEAMELAADDPLREALSRAREVSRWGREGAARGER